MTINRYKGLITFTRNVYFIFLMFTLIGISCKKETAQEKFGDIKGKITNELGQPIPDAIITIGAIRKNSDSNGNYYFAKLLVGEQQVFVSKESYLDKVESAEIIDKEVIVLDITLQAGETSLELSDSVLEVLPSAWYVYIKVIANAAWQIENSSSWLECSLQSGEGNANIKLEWTSNDGSESRADTIYVKSGDIIRKIAVTQDFALRLLSSTGIIGNGQNDVSDSVLLLFNKPIQVDQITSFQENCISPIEYSLIQNNFGVRFTYNCAELGGQYSFRVKVKYNENNKFDQTITVGFYDKMTNLEGVITDFLVTSDTKNCWISTKSPNRLVYVSVDSLEIKVSLDLDFPPTKFTLNPFNHLLYVLSGDPEFYSYDSTIYVVNPGDGSLVKKVIIHPEENGHPQYPTIFPYDIGFTNTGYGVVLLHQDGSSGLDWRVIDSSHDDTLYFHVAHGYDNDQYQYFSRIYWNYDQTKLLLMEPYGSCDLDVLDGTSHDIVNIIPGSITQGVFITPNRTNDRVYFGQLYDQFIMDLEGNMSQKSYIDNRSNGSADFCYLQGKDNIIYFIDDDFLQVLDYGNSVTLMWCDVRNGLRRFTTSLDGRFALAVMNNYPGSSLYKFNITDFWRHSEKALTLINIPSRNITFP
jgi:hypothetical protein